MRGARAVQESVLEKFPGTDISVSLVWLKMLSDDSKETANKEAGNFSGPRVRQFYDPDKRSGKAIAKSLGYQDKIAWDIYLFYKGGAEWIAVPPPPAYWMHQLSETWADREHFHSGDDLVRELSVTMKKLGL